MNRRSIIHELRCALALKRQPEHESDLETLLLAVSPSDHPYREGKKPDCYSRLLKLPEFRWPSKGFPATLVSGTYLFHLQPMEGLFKKLRIKPPPQSPFPPNPDPTINLDKVRTLLEEAMLGEPWIPLALIADGLYEAEPLSGEGRRFITWWTDLAIEQDKILRYTHQIGVPDNWLTSDCILLRCVIDSEIKAHARVPSALDGFASEIFLPSDYSVRPEAGRAIDIETDPFGQGSAEVVLGPIDVSRISMRLIQIPRAATLANYVDSGSPVFLERLEQYYRSKLI